MRKITAYIFYQNRSFMAEQVQSSLSHCYGGGCLLVQIGPSELHYLVHTQLESYHYYEMEEDNKREMLHC